MKYRKNIKNGDELSILGFGCMRFPKNTDDVEKQIVYAIENGVNFFDTAYTYGKSEEILGKILAKGYRKKVKLATKLPPHLIKSYQDFDKIFNKQLQRLQTDYIDYYFIHALTDLKIWERLVKLGICEWINEKKKQGRIINLGFSYHGGENEFLKLIDGYDWDFCMIQYNYLDENKQAGRKGLCYAHEKQIPVIVMEPLRGGTLVKNLPSSVLKLMQKTDKAKTPAEWGLRWVWHHQEVTLLLSGMNDLAMVKENIKVASQVEGLNEKEKAMFQEIQKLMLNSSQIPCTGCNYCLPCPYNVDIPTCFSCYNDYKIEGWGRGVVKYIMQTSLKQEAQNASRCTQCGICEKKCPQNIAIRSELTKVQKKLEGIHYRPMRFIIKKILKV